MNKVGILVSKGYGAGWSTWSSKVDPCNKELVELFVNGASDEDKLAKADEIYPDVYTGGLLDCEVVMVDEGTLFKISEYDGYESLELRDSDDWMIAK